MKHKFLNKNLTIACYAFFILNMKNVDDDIKNNEKDKKEYLYEHIKFGIGTGIAFQSIDVTSRG